MKKPAAAKVTVKGNDTKASDHRPWLKIKTTVAKKPERAYLTGTKEMGEKSRLIVEVSKVRSKRCLKVIGKIMQALKKENLSKEEAIALRGQLCLEYPCVATPLQKGHLQALGGCLCKMASKLAVQAPMGACMCEHICPPL